MPIKQTQQLDLMSTLNFLEDKNLESTRVQIVTNVLVAGNYEILEESCHIVDSWLEPPKDGR